MPAATSSKRIAVTGAAGFFGSALLPRLLGGRYERILALDIREPSFRDHGITYRRIDLTHPTVDQTLLELFRSFEIDTVVHTAFLSEPAHQSSWAHELEAIGTLQVLNACAEHGVRKVVLLSSTVVYGPHPENPNYLCESHPLRGLPGSRYVQDRVEAERQLQRFKRENPQVICASARLAPVVGPTVRNWVTRYLSFPMPLRLLGYDPLLQCLHETDAIDALTLLVDRDCDGPWNIVADGVLPLSRALEACGRLSLPVPEPVARVYVEALWTAQLLNLPPTFLRFLRYLCVADGTRAQEELGFTPRYGTVEALHTFAQARGLNAARGRKAA